MSYTKYTYKKRKCTKTGTIKNIYMYIYMYGKGTRTVRVPVLHTPIDERNKYGQLHTTNLPNHNPSRRYRSLNIFIALAKFRDGINRDHTDSNTNRTTAEPKRTRAVRQTEPNGTRTYNVGFDSHF